MTAKAPDPDEERTIPAIPSAQWDATVAPTIASSRPPVPRQPIEGEIAPGGVFGGRFEIVHALGRGGMGAVYRARDRQVNGREVALKVLLERFSRDPQFRELFFREIHAAQKFVSEHVVQVRDTGQAPDGTLFLTMDLVQGESLRALLDRENALNPRHALEIARQMLLGLASGHERGFVHRDVKPSNVMLAGRIPKTDDNPFGIGVRLLDFGIAGLAAQLDTETLTGTPKYMSPEQVQGQRLDARSDIFAVGIVLYEMIAGSRPFEGDTLEEITTSLIETDVAPMIARMGELSPPVRKILQRALQKDRERRFQNAGEFVRAIERSRAFKLPKVMPTWALSAIVVSLGVNGALAYLWNGSREKLEAQRDELNATRARTATEVFEARRPLEGRIATLESQLVANAGTIDSLKEEIARRESASTVARIDEKSEQTLVAAVDESESRRLQSQVDSLRQEIVDLRQENRRLDDRVRAGERMRSPEGQRAEAYDELLQHVLRDSGESAHFTLEAWRRRGVFDKAGMEGRGFVDALVAAAYGLWEIDSAREAGGGVERAKIDDVELRVRRARDAFRFLDAQGRAWLAFSASDEPPPQRLEIGERALAHVDARVAALRASIHEAAPDRWDSLHARGLLQDPAEILRYGREFDRTRPAAFLGELARHVEHTVVDERGFLPEALTDLGALDAWDEHLAAHPAGFEPADVASIRLFAHARRMYLGSDQRGYDWSGQTWPTLEGRTRDWRAELRLLDESWSRGALFPPARRGHVVHANLRGGEPTWRDAQLVEAATNAGWRTRSQQRLGNGGTFGAATDRRFTREARIVLASTSTGADHFVTLRPGPHVLGIEPLPPLPPVAEPPPGVTAAQLAQFRSEYEARKEPCIVLRVAADALMWVSPEYGVVREERDGPFPIWQLVYAAPRR